MDGVISIDTKVSLLVFSYRKALYPVGNYKKKSRSPRWSEETISKAIMSVIFGNVGIRKIADLFKVPPYDSSESNGKNPSQTRIRGLACEDINLINIRQPSVLGADVKMDHALGYRHLKGVVICRHCKCAAHLALLRREKESAFL
jgi:hypothetical protein